jgi:hypothetical protein
MSNDGEQGAAGGTPAPRSRRHPPRTGREVQPIAHPEGRPGPAHFRVVDVPVRDPGAGEVLVRNTWTSVDPGLRLRLRATGPRGYFAPFALRTAMDGILTVGTVVASRADGFAPGDAVWHAAGWRDYAVVRAGEPALGGLGMLTRLDTGLAPAQRYLGRWAGWASPPTPGCSRRRACAPATSCGCRRPPARSAAWPRSSPGCAAIA